MPRQYIQDIETHTCRICNTDHSGRAKFSKHVTNTHKIKIKSYYDEFIRVEKEGLCIFCNNETSFGGLGFGYKRSCKNCKALEAKRLRDELRCDPIRFEEFTKRVSENQTQIWAKRPRVIKKSKKGKHKYQAYRNKVDTITYRNFRKYRDIIDPENKHGVDYHIDHKFSVKQGYQKNIPPEVIGNIYNLQILPAEENKAKNFRSSISLEELLSYEIV
jgi:hypothetical protein